MIEFFEIITNLIKILVHWSTLIVNNSKKCEKGPCKNDKDTLELCSTFGFRFKNKCVAECAYPPMKPGAHQWMTSLKPCNILRK